MSEQPITTEQQIEEMEILDPTPRELTIGDRTFQLKPLVMRQYKKLFTIIGGALAYLRSNAQGDALKDLTVALEEVRENPANLAKYADTILLFAYDAIIDCLAVILDVEPAWLEDNLQMGQFAQVAFVVYQQNDVDEIIRSFSRLGRLASMKGHLPAQISPSVGGASTRS